MAAEHGADGVVRVDETSASDSGPTPSAATSTRVPPVSIATKRDEEVVCVSQAGDEPGVRVSSNSSASMESSAKSGASMASRALGSIDQQARSAGGSCSGQRRRGKRAVGDGEGDEKRRGAQHTIKQRS